MELQIKKTRRATVRREGSSGNLGKIAKSTISIFILNICKLFFVAACVFLQPVCAFAAEGEGADKPEWVISYFLVCLCLGLGVAILLRPCNRSESAFSQDELNARHEEAMKKLMKH